MEPKKTVGQYTQSAKRKKEKKKTVSEESYIHKNGPSKGREREFLGGLVVRILGFHYHGPGSIPGWETEILQAVQHSKKKEKTKKREGQIMTFPDKQKLRKFVTTRPGLLKKCSRESCKVK